MDGKTCESCAHYRLHYVRIDQKFHEIALGHCVYPRVKSRDRDTKACGHYQEKTSQKTKPLT